LAGDLHPFAGAHADRESSNSATIASTVNSSLPTSPTTSRPPLALLHLDTPGLRRALALALHQPAPELRNLNIEDVVDVEQATAAPTFGDLGSRGLLAFAASSGRICCGAPGRAHGPPIQFSPHATPATESRSWRCTPR
jgi:hypothetical protein